MRPLPTNEGWQFNLGKELIELFEANSIQLRCDSGDRFPAPCSRCARSGRTCSVDPTFKRTKRRDRLDELEREIRMIRGSLPGPDEQTSPQGSAGSIAPATPDLAQISTVIDHQEPKFEVSESTVEVSQTTLETQRLEQVEVAPMLFLELIEEYSPNPPKLFAFCSCPLGSSPAITLGSHYFPAKLTRW
jgi:hypothetical protein